MKKYRFQRIIHENVIAARFDSPDRLPQGVKKTGHPRVPYTLETLGKNGRPTLEKIEFGEWIVYNPDGSHTILNHDRFMEHHTPIETVDSVDVTHEYLPRKEGDTHDEEEQPNRKGSADAEVSSSRGEEQD